MKTELQKLDRALEAWRWSTHCKLVREGRTDLAYMRVQDMQRRHTAELRLHATEICGKALVS